MVHVMRIIQAALAGALFVALGATVVHASAAFPGNLANYFRRATHDVMNGSGDQTIVYWLRPSASMSANGNPLVHEYIGSPTWSYTYDSYNATTNVLTLAEEDNGTELLLSAGTLSRDTWYRVGRRLSGTTFTAWINGVQVNSGTFDPASRTYTSGQGTFVGRGQSFSPWYGDIGDICIWHRALSDAEMRRVAKVRNCQVAAGQGLRVWWPIHGGANRHLDYSGGGRNLTSNGTITDGAATPAAWGVRAFAPVM